MKVINKWTISILVTLIIVLTSIGYSAFNSTLSISGLAATVRMDSDIRVSGIKVSEASANVISNYEEYNTSNITSSVNLPLQDSYIIYEVDVTNYGNIEMGIKEIINNNTNLKYELLDYVLQDKICNESDNCTLGITKAIRIKVSYNNYDSSNTTQLLKLDFSFDSYHNVVYSGITNEGYKTIAMNDTNFVVTFSENVNNLTVTMGGLTLSIDEGYTYQDNILTIFNVTGNLKISSEAEAVDLLKGRYVEAGKTITKNGLTVTSLGDGEFQLDGTINSGSLYVKLTDYFSTGTSGGGLNTNGVPAALLTSSQAFNFNVSVISGSVVGVTIADALKITFRNLSSAYIATIGYDFFSGYLPPGTIGENVGSLVLYTSKTAKTFNSYRFKISITLGETEDDPTGEIPPIDITGCLSITSSTKEFTVTRCPDGLIDLTSDGGILSTYYIYATNTMLRLAKTGTGLYDAALESNPKYVIGDTVSIVYQYVRGLPSLSKTNSINFVLRDTTTMEAVASPKVMNVIGGGTYLIDFESQGVLTSNVADVSIYLNNNITLDHYQFYLTARKDS